MKLVSNWSDVLLRAWSIRWIVIAGLLSGAEVCLPLIDELVEIPRGLFAVLSLISTMGAFWSRIVAQKGLSDGK